MHSNQRLAKLKRSPVDFYLLTLNKLQSLMRVLDVTEKYSANFLHDHGWLAICWLIKTGVSISEAILSEKINSMMTYWGHKRYLSLSDLMLKSLFYI